MILSGDKNRAGRILKLSIPTDRSLTSEELGKILGWFKTRKDYLNYLKSIYDLHHDIEGRTFYKTVINPETDEEETVIDLDRPNNKLINDFPGYIVTVASGYFMGKPVSYSVKADGNEENLNLLQDILDYNDEQALNLNIAKNQSIYGTAFELNWLDDAKYGKRAGKTIVRMSSISPLEGFIVYDPENIEETPLVGFRVISYHDILEEKDRVIVEEYTDSDIYVYEGDDFESLTLRRAEAHGFKQLPITEYPNNEFRFGDYERVLSLINAYDLITSDGVNESEDMSDSLLLIKNMMGTDANDIRRVKQSKVIKTDEDGDAKFITKGSNNTADGSIPMELTLTKNIHKFSYVPPLDDTNFSGNSSGVAMEFKVWGLEQEAANKERYFKKGLMRRIEIIFEYMMVLKGEGFDFTDIEIKFNRNLPRDIASISDMIVKLKDTVSDETMIGWLPQIEDPKSEYEKLVTQRKENSKMESKAMYGDPFIEDNNNLDKPQYVEEDK